MNAAARFAAVLLWPVLGCVESERPIAEAPTADSPHVIIDPAALARDRVYSPGVLAGDKLYLAGQLGFDPQTWQLPEGVEAQTRRAMESVGVVLREAGMDYSNLVKCNVYLDDMDNYTGMNGVYGSFFSGRVPARTTIEVPGLPREAAVEITCIAYRDLSRIEVVEVPEGTLPVPLGPYSPAVWAGDTLYVSGMGGRHPDGHLPGSLEEQAVQTLVNIARTLEAAGLLFDNVVFAAGYLTDPAGIGVLEDVYRSRFEAAGGLPARSSFAVTQLPGGIQVEITFMAVRNASARTLLTPPDAPPGGPVPAASVAGKTLYSAAVSAPEAGGDAESQLRESLRRLEVSLKTSGLDLSNVASVHGYLKTMEHMNSWNTVFREFFPSAPPARTTVEMIYGGHREGVEGEVSLVAVRGTGHGP